MTAKAKRCVGSHAQLVRIQRPLKTPCLFSIGSICSGLHTDLFALKSLLGRGMGLVDTAFTCDLSTASQDFGEMNWPEVRCKFKDVQSDDFQSGAPPVTVLTAGFPCQPFSLQGKGHGIADARATVIHAILSYIQRAGPRIVVLENVAGLAYKHPAVLLYVLKNLKLMKNDKGKLLFTHVEWKMVNSLHIGAVPQNRPRIYIIAIKSKHGPPCWPSTVPTPSLKTILGKRADMLPTAPVACKKVKMVYNELAENGLSPERVPVVIDCNAHKLRWLLHHTPCLTATRGASGGFFVTLVGRMLNMDELFRLQGFEPTNIITTGLSPAKVGHLIGNAFTKTVIERILIDLLPRAGIVRKDHMRDRLAI